MKLILFTISNEQIKEQLSKLQMKVESLEAVKEVQDKIISTKDSQISFLNDQIANIWTPIAIVAGFIAIVFGYVAWLNRQADKKVKQGVEQFSLAQEKIEQAEALIQQSESAATIAQEKIDELEEKHKELYDLATATTTNQKIDMSIREIDMYLDMSKNIIYDIMDYNEKYNVLSAKQTEKLSYVNRQHTSFFHEYRRLFSIFSADIAEKQKIDIEKIIDDTNHLKMNSINLYKECLDLTNELDLQD